MFTGIIEEVGRVESLEQGADSARLSIRAPKIVSDAHLGDSISVHGVCLTVTDHAGEVFVTDVMGETLSRSSLGSCLPGTRVNLERALKVGARFGGHVVQGHVDGVGQVLARTPEENWEVLRVGLPTGLARYVVEKGSITVNGTSLTVSAVASDYFEVSLIPTTLSETTAGDLEIGEVVNLEVDIVAKYVEKLLTGYH